ncbi:hypothetical protein NC652_035703 [Populus alba x Populus x berolinensis]|nr:hypothetical protein NC652_035703 [Populus alba x Populus x berolinensis]
MKGFVVEIDEDWCEESDILLRLVEDECFENWGSE